MMRAEGLAIRRAARARIIAGAGTPLPVIRPPYPHFLDRATIALNRAQPPRDDQSLTQRTHMPGTARPRFERDAASANSSRLAANNRSTQTAPVKYRPGPYREGCELLRS